MISDMGMRSIGHACSHTPRSSALSCLVMRAPLGASLVVLLHGWSLPLLCGTAGGHGPVHAWCRGWAHAAHPCSWLGEVCRTEGERGSHVSALRGVGASKGDRDIAHAHGPAPACRML